MTRLTLRDPRQTLSDLQWTATLHCAPDARRVLTDEAQTLAAKIDAATRPGASAADVHAAYDAAAEARRVMRLWRGAR